MGSELENALLDGVSLFEFDIGAGRSHSANKNTKDGTESRGTM